MPHSVLETLEDLINAPERTFHFSFSKNKKGWSRVQEVVHLLANFHYFIVKSFCFEEHCGTLFELWIVTKLWNIISLVYKSSFQSWDLFTSHSIYQI